MNLPVLLAVDVLDGANPVTITMALAGATSYGLLVKWMQKIESRSDQHEKQLTEGETALKSVAEDLKAKAEANQKWKEDTVHRISQIEGREGRVDERMLAYQSSLQDVKKGQEQLLGMMTELLNMERHHARRRRDDKDAA